MFFNPSSKRATQYSSAASFVALASAVDRLSLYDASNVAPEKVIRYLSGKVFLISDRTCKR